MARLYLGASVRAKNQPAMAARARASSRATTGISASVMGGTPDALSMVRGNQIQQAMEDIMRALHTTLALETGTTWTPGMTVKARRPATEHAERGAAWATMRNMALFLMAPFVGLVYAVLLPFVGLGMLAWIGARAFVESGALARMLRVARRVLLVVAAPFVGLVYIVTLPFIGLAMLAWFAGKALLPARAA
jgi:hypothetical protein